MPRLLYILFNPQMNMRQGLKLIHLAWYVDLPIQLIIAIVVDVCHQLCGEVIILHIYFK